LNRATLVWFLDDAGHFRYDWSWNPFYNHLHCTSALACTEVISSLRKWKQLVLINCMTACPGTVWWLNCAFVNSVWLTAMIRSENYKQQRHEKHLKHNDFASIFVFTFNSYWSNSVACIWITWRHRHLVPWFYKEDNSIVVGKR
jgi:hypothetical protein